MTLNTPQKRKNKWFRWVTISPPSIMYQGNNGIKDTAEENNKNNKEGGAPLTKPPQLVLIHRTPRDPRDRQEGEGNENIRKSSRKRGESSGIRFSVSRFCSTLLSSITVEPILFLYMLSTFSQYASFQDLVFSRACLQSFEREVCENLHLPQYSGEAETVQEKASHLILLSTTALVLPSICIAVYLGSWSDRFGRKWPILFPPMGGVLASLVLIVLAFYPSIPIQWIFLSSFLSGMFGGFVSCIMSCMSYVSAISGEENRTVRISRLEAMTFLGGTVGPFLSGSFLPYVGHGVAFVFMMGCYMVAFLYALLCVKEVTKEQEEEAKRGSSSIMKQAQEESTEHLLPPEEPSVGGGLLNLPDVARSSVYVDTTTPMVVEDGKYLNSSPSPRSDDGRSSSSSEREILRKSGEDEDDLREGKAGEEGKVSWVSRYFGSQHFMGALKTVVKKREGGRRGYLILTLVAGYIGMVMTAGELDVAFLFAKGEPLLWSHKTFSYYFGLKYGLGSLLLLVGSPIIQQFHVRDSTVCVIGLLSRMAGLVLYALSPSTPIAFLVPIVGIFSFLSIPATRSLLSKLVSPDEQGKIFAFVAIMEDLCTLTASMIFNSLYPMTRRIMNGFIFILAAALLILPVGIMWFIGRRLEKRAQEEEESDEESRRNGKMIKNNHHHPDDLTAERNNHI